jgi:hypothetical protein
MRDADGRYQWADAPPFAVSLVADDRSKRLDNPRCAPYDRSAQPSDGCPMTRTERRCHMDRGTKKKIEALNKRLQKMRQQLAGAKQQDDEPGEVARLEQEIADTEGQVAKLKAS